MLTFLGGKLEQYVFKLNTEVLRLVIQLKPGGSNNHEPLNPATGAFRMLFNQIDEAYCVDMQTLSSDMRDLVRFDEVMVKLDMTSGAILSRNKKSKVMGVGSWEGKQD